MNTLTIVGNLVRDLELKFLDAGTAVAECSVAVTKKGFNDKPDKTSFVRVSLYGSLAENAANSLRKGDRVIASGRMEQRTWEKGEAWELKAEAIGADLRFSTAKLQEKSYSKTTPVYDDGDAF